MTATRLNTDYSETMNIVSATRVAVTVTTGATGNYNTGYVNDGKTAIVAPHVSGTDVYLRAWVSTNYGSWFLTATDPNTGSTRNNTSLAIRFWVLKFKNS